MCIQLGHYSASRYNVIDPTLNHPKTLESSPREQLKVLLILKVNGRNLKEESKLKEKLPRKRESVEKASK